MLGREDLIDAIELGRRRHRATTAIRRARGRALRPRRAAAAAGRGGAAAGGRGRERRPRRRRLRRGTRRSSRARSRPTTATQPTRTDDAEAPRRRRGDRGGDRRPRHHLPQGYGFLRLSGPASRDEGDVYVSASQIRRCELRRRRRGRGPGPLAAPRRAPPRAGPRRQGQRRGARGERPTSSRTSTAVAPEPRHPARRRGRATSSPGRSTCSRRSPSASGCWSRPSRARAARRCCARSPRRSRPPTPTSVILLIDERPEEVTAWERPSRTPRLAVATGRQDARRAGPRSPSWRSASAKRRAESGADVVVIVDSLSRLALGYRDPDRVKPIFGAGRDLAEDGARLADRDRDRARHRRRAAQAVPRGARDDRERADPARRRASPPTGICPSLIVAADAASPARRSCAPADETRRPSASCAPSSTSSTPEDAAARAAERSRTRLERGPAARLAADELALERNRHADPEGAARGAAVRSSCRGRRRRCFPTKARRRARSARSRDRAGCSRRSGCPRRRRCRARPP